MVNRLGAEKCVRPAELPQARCPVIGLTVWALLAGWRLDQGVAP